MDQYKFTQKAPRIQTLLNKVPTIEQDLRDEITRAEGADATLQTAINTEASRAQSAEGTLQTAINTEVSRAQEAEADLHTAVNDRYTKSETYNREQINSMITTPEQGYVTATATQETTAATDVLPAQGEDDTIYRVGCWDGTQYDDSAYSEYAWDGTQYVLLDTKTPGIDDVPINGSNNLVKSGGVFDSIHDTVYKSGELKQADVDKYNKIYHAIDDNDKEHFYLDLMFHGRLDLANPNNTNIGRTSINDSIEYKKVDIDEYRHIYHAIDANDVEHHYLDQVFHGNVTLPEDIKRLNILVIGNSFTGDMLSQITGFINASGASQGITIYHLHVGGGYLEFYSGIIDAGDAVKNHSYGGNAVKLTHVFGSSLGISDNNTMAEIFAQNWDVLALCQVSGYAIDYSTFKPYMCKILTAFDHYCLNSSYKKAWMTSWSRGNKESIPDAIKMLTGWTNIMGVVRQLEADFGRSIDTYIPASTAIQNARNTSINPVGDFTRDWHHAATGYGVWMVGACFYETVISPFNGVSLWSFNYYVTVSQEVIDETYNEYGTVVGSVTAENIDTLRTCVENAIINQFEIV